MNENTSLSAHEAHYNKEEGKLYLKNCLLQRGTDRLESHTLSIDLTEEILEFDQVSGQLTSLIVPNRTCCVQGEKLYWNHQSKTLSLSGNAVIRDLAECDLKAPQIHIKQSLLYNSPLMDSITTEGLTILSHREHTLTCQTGLHFIRETLHCTSIGGIEYKGDHLHLLADTLDLEGTLVKYQLQPLSMHLTGNIAIEKDGKKCLADTLDFDKPLKRLRLTGDRVLIMQERPSLTLSAGEVIMTKNGIKGVGPVHFTFSADELERFKKTFPHAMISP
ncbi:MAG: hypothetical protein S4CHLAM107_12120 [Chlamydiia bacterium]|nr:hypothetical protein [Chlamydiia bacterium]